MMIDIDDLREKQASYETLRQEQILIYKNLERSRGEFVKKFPISKLSILPIERYVSGKEDSFCYWLEVKLAPLGKIQGGSTAPNKYGVYFGRTKQDDRKKYRAISKWGASYKQAYENIRQELVLLLEAGRRKDLDAIQANPLSPMFKGKILATYYPNDYVSIFSEEYVDHYLNQLELYDFADKMYSVEEKRQKLLNFKNNDSLMKKWTNYEFMRFLISEFGRPNETVIDPELKDYILPDINTVQPEFIQATFDKLGKKSTLHGNGSKNSGVANFEKKNRRAKQIGDRGEQIVIRSEREYLKSQGLTNLTVIHKANENSFAGYDVLSYDKDGHEKHIEVKSTTAKFGEVNFIITSNELDKANNLPNYFVYLVFQANTEHPKIVQFSFNDLSNNQFNMVPFSYQVRIKPSISG